MEKFCKYCGNPLKERVACYDRELYCDCEQIQLANELSRKIRTTQDVLNADIEDYEHMPYTSDKGKEFISLIKQRDALNYQIHNMENDYGFSEETVKKWCW